MGTIAAGRYETAEDRRRHSAIAKLGGREAGGCRGQDGKSGGLRWSRSTVMGRLKGLSRPITRV